MKRKYNGIESEDALGLDLYEMDWRTYDPSIGRFNSIDLFAEYMYSHTPYHFSYNSPIYFSDPSGLCPNEDCDNTNGLDEGAEASTSEGTNWIVKDGKWVPTNAIGLDEVIVEGDSKSENSSEDNSESGGEGFYWGFETWTQGSRSSDGISGLKRAKGADVISVGVPNNLFTKAGHFVEIIIFDMTQRIKSIRDYFSDTYSPSATMEEKISNDIDYITAQKVYENLRIRNNSPQSGFQWYSYRDTLILNDLTSAIELKKANDSVKDQAYINAISRIEFLKDSLK